VDIAHPPPVDHGKDALQIYRIPADILNKESGTADEYHKQAFPSGVRSSEDDATTPLGSMKGGEFYGFAARLFTYQKGNLLHRVRYHLISLKKMKRVNRWMNIISPLWVHFIHFT
jgi:hypothetical protein